jgi:hypothetical protein
VSESEHERGEGVPDELMRRAWRIDDAAAGLVRDFGEEGNPDMTALRDELEEELVWLALERVQRRRG